MGKAVDRRLSRHEPYRMMVPFSGRDFAMSIWPVPRPFCSASAATRSHRDMPSRVTWCFQPVKATAPLGGRPSTNSWTWYDSCSPTARSGPRRSTKALAIYSVQFLEQCGKRARVFSHAVTPPRTPPLRHFVLGSHGCRQRGKCLQFHSRIGALPSRDWFDTTVG